MGQDRDQTRYPWICSQTRICCQTRYRLRYAARLYASLKRKTMSKLINRIRGWRLLLTSLQGSAFFLKTCLVNLISKDNHLVFSVKPMWPPLEILEVITSARSKSQLSLCISYKLIIKVVVDQDSSFAG